MSAPTRVSASQVVGDFSLFDLSVGFESPNARLTDPITSHEAADSVQSKAAQSRDFVLYLLRDIGPASDHELVDAADLLNARLPETPRFSPSRLRTARHELARDGVVTDTGYFHLTGSGRRAQVWQVAA